MKSDPLPADGIVTSVATVERSWLDYNEHMNVAYYVMVFDLGIDAFKDVIGISLDYIAERHRSTVALESHITYNNEASLGDELRIATRVIDFDGKRVHIYQEMYRDKDLLSTQETLSISFDTAARKSCEFEESVAERYEWMLAAQRTIALPKWVGGAVGIRRK